MMKIKGEKNNNNVQSDKSNYIYKWCDRVCNNNRGHTTTYRIHRLIKGTRVQWIMREMERVRVRE